MRTIIRYYYELEMFCPEHELLKYLVREDNRLQIKEDTLDEFMKRFGPNFDKFFEENRGKINSDKLFSAVTYNRYFIALEKELARFEKLSEN
jgi:hypothetical protein